MAQQKRHGFTLIELLVVMIIIGILAALVTPAIMSAMRRSKEFTITSEMKQIEGALEKFKNEYGVYPVDFGNSDFWYGATLSGNRRPQTIDRAEALVVWLGGVSKNPEFPLGVLGFANGYIDDPGYKATRFFEFDETRLKDLDNDGWMEYYPASGPQNPYVYFDARTLRGTNAPDAGTVDLVRNQSVYPSIHSPELFAGQIRTDPGIPSAGKPIAAYMNTDASAFINATNAKHTYQLIAAGMDGEFGADLTGEYDYTSGTTSVRLVTNSDDSSPDLNLTIYRSHRDNITNLKDGSRLDVDN